MNEDYECGVTLGIVELYDVKPVAEFTQTDWEKTKIPRGSRWMYEGHYGWFMRNPRPFPCIPVKGQLGIYNLKLPENVPNE